MVNNLVDVCAQGQWLWIFLGHIVSSVRRQAWGRRISVIVVFIRRGSLSFVVERVLVACTPRARNSSAWNGLGDSSELVCDYSLFRLDVQNTNAEGSVFSDAERIFFLLHKRNGL